MKKWFKFYWYYFYLTLASIVVNVINHVRTLDCMVYVTRPVEVLVVLTDLLIVFGLILTVVIATLGILRKVKFTEILLLQILLILIYGSLKYFFFAFLVGITLC